MKRLTKYLAVWMVLLLAGVILPAGTSYGASAEVTIAADSAEITVGDQFFVYIYIDSAEEFGNFEANLTYDTDILEYQEGASVISGGDGFLKISDMNVLNGDTSRKYTLKFHALKAGYCDIAFSGRAIVYDLDQNEMSVSKTGMTIHVKAPVTASSNAKLKSMNINPSALSPAFDPAITEYTTTVAYDTDTLIVTAIPEDLKATVSIQGNELLKEGENKVIVSVLAESGDIIEYNIKVTKDAAPPETPTGSVTEVPSDAVDSFALIAKDGVVYAVYSGKYTILEPDSSVVIPEGYKKGSLILSGVSVTAFLPIDNEESEFILLYAMNGQQETGFYQYDRIEKTMQRYQPDSLVINESGTSPEDKSVLEIEYRENMTKAVVVIALLAALSAIMAIIAIRLLLKSKGSKRDDFQ